MQVVRACRADERLKPLLQSSGSSSAAKDRLLAHLSRLKIRNDFEPVLSPESSLFLLKSNKQVIALQWLCCSYLEYLFVMYNEIKCPSILGGLSRYSKILDRAKICSSAQNFIDIYLRLPGIPANGQLQESDYIRVRICEGRFSILIREPIREGNFIIQPKVDFDISISTVAGLLKLG
ncbi:hypothetical protein NL676_038853 [Syzygium grande]|nr:hypothetical protein NL676_038853 [Syzygium grande]